MTCIAAIKSGDGTIFMGADSAGVLCHEMIIRNDPKVFLRDNFLIGFTSSFRMGQLLQYQLEIPSRPDGISDHEYLVRYFVEAVRKCFQKGGYTGKEDERESGGTFLLGYHGEIYHVDHDFQVGQRQDPFDSVGSGAQAALGALYATTDSPHSEASRLELALTAASRFNVAVRAPFNILKMC